MIRVTWFYGLVTLACVLEIALDIWHPLRSEPVNWPALFGLGALSLGLALTSSRDIWALHERRLPLWADALMGIAVVAFLIAVVVVRESRIYVWNAWNLNIPFLLLLAPITLSAIVTERKKGVWVYMHLRGFAFRRL